MAILNYFNYKTRQQERIDTALLTDAKARELIPQDRVSQDIYVYARRTGCGIGEAMSRVFTEGKR